MTTSKIFAMALLAEGSYGRFNEAVPGPNEVTRALRAEDISERQINDLKQNFALLHHLSNRDSGFSATLFQEKGSSGTTGLTLAIRGTEPLAQFGVDLIAADLGGIVIEGAATKQITDLYNYWKQLTAAFGATVRLARIVETDDPNASAVFTPAMIVGSGSSARSSYRRVEFFDQAGAGLGVLSGPVSALTVTGHSLGGHLATAFQRLFPLVVGEVYTVNGAGTRESDISSRFFDALAGQYSAFDATRISNLYGSAGPNVVSGELVYTQIGDRGEIYTESIMDVGGHGNKQMTDSVAVYDLFIRADDGFKSQSAAQLSASLSATFKAADAQAGFTLEALVNAFGKLFVPGYAPITREQADQRELLHARIIAIRDLLPASSGDLGIETLADKPAAELVNLANTDIAYRYALRELNPFAVVGADYARHNTDGSLDLYAAATGRGLTERWLEARARLLHAVSDYNRVDGSVNVNTIGAHFEDRARNIAFGPIAATTARIVFGRDNQALLATGSAVGDSLVGAAGSDVLSGAAGNDYLEGGAGADTLDGGLGNDDIFGNDGDDVLIAGGDRDALHGGSGFDTYEVEAGAGFAVIHDSDGQGRLLLSGTLVDGGVKQSGNTFRSEDGAFTFAFTGDLNTAGTLTIGTDVRVENFHNGDLGIVLDGPAESDLPIAVYEYSRYSIPDNAIFDPYSGSNPFYGSYANDVFRYGVVDLANRQFGNDPHHGFQLDDRTYRGWGGDDVYFGAYHYGETFFGDAGDDVIYGGALGAEYIPFDGAVDADQIFGGSGRDTIFGGKGNDSLYGDFRSVLVVGFAPGNWPDLGPYSGSAPGSLPNLQRVSLDIWTALQRFQPDVSVEGRGQSGQTLSFDNGQAQGLEAAFRDYLGLGDDTDTAQFYDDFVSGGAGNDRIFGGYGSDTLLGDGGDDFIDGDALSIRSDLILAEYAALFGRPGDDYLDGGAGDDTLLDRGRGNDALYGGAGNDVLISSDFFTGDEDAAPPTYSNFLDGGDGDDVLDSINGSVLGFDYVDGGAGDDTLLVSSNQSFGGGYVFVLGGTGDDDIGVGSLNGHVDGGDGNDTLSILGDEDSFVNGGQNDALSMAIFGGGGDDSISANGRVSIDGGDGDDRIEWEPVERQVAAGIIRGGAGNDHITVRGPAIVDGGGGDDEIRITASSGSIRPGAGRDRLVIAVASGAVSDLVLELGEGGTGNADSLVFERISGDGLPWQAGEFDLRMQRSGSDLQLDLVNVISGGGEINEARVQVHIRDWFASGGARLETIRVEGLRSWTAAEATALASLAVVAAPLIHPLVPPVSPLAVDVPATPNDAPVVIVAVIVPVIAAVIAAVIVPVSVPVSVAEPVVSPAVEMVLAQSPPSDGPAPAVVTQPVSVPPEVVAVEIVSAELAPSVDTTPAATVVTQPVSVPPEVAAVEIVSAELMPSVDTMLAATVVTQPASAPQVPTVFEFAPAVLLQPAVLGGGTRVSNTTEVRGAPAFASDSDSDDSGPSAADAVAAYLEQHLDGRESRFSFAAESAGRVQTRQTEDAVQVSPERIATQWSALHAYMDELAATTNMDERYAAPPARSFGQAGVLASTEGGFAQAGMADVSRIEIRDSSLGTFRPLPGLAEGFAQLG